MVVIGRSKDGFYSIAGSSVHGHPPAGDSRALRPRDRLDRDPEEASLADQDLVHRVDDPPWVRQAPWCKDRTDREHHLSHAGPGLRGRGQAGAGCSSQSPRRRAAASATRPALPERAPVRRLAGQEPNRFKIQGLTPGASFHDPFHRPPESPRPVSPPPRKIAKGEFSLRSIRISRRRYPLLHWPRSRPKFSRIRWSLRRSASDTCSPWRSMRKRMSCAVRQWAMAAAASSRASATSAAVR